MSQSQENLWADRKTDGRTDRQTLFYRTLLAEARGRKNVIKPSNYKYRRCQICHMHLNVSESCRMSNVTKYCKSIKISFFTK